MPRRDAPPCTRLVFVLHFHQAYGNLGPVFEDATDRCYLPTLDLLGANPHVRAGIHLSGTLLQWFLRHRPVIIERLRMLIARAQVELLGGGLEEPVLAVLPERDAHGQLTLMADLCEQTFGPRPRGMWLAERVWEPHLPRIIAGAGYRYTLLDDNHLFSAGLTGRAHGYYVTESGGSSVAIFPIDRDLRARIPFSSVDHLLHYLYGARGEVITYGDDVEKLGLWPTTQKRVWLEKWLESLFAAFKDNGEWLRTETPSMVLPDEPSGLVYLPSISYAEMSTWSLPAEAAVRLVDLLAELEKAGLRDAAEPFLRGGTWSGFLAKYPESRRIYRKMVRVSQMVEDARARGDEGYEAARAALYRGQSNTAYWHGLFGGLYLPHLRSALTTALLDAEVVLAPAPKPSITVSDYETDFFNDVLLEGPHVNVHIHPSRGGYVSAMDLRAPRFLLTDVLGQRFEVYHCDVPRAPVLSDEELKVTSAHEIVRAAERGLIDKLKVDTYDRGAFIDHLLPAGADIRSLVSGVYAPLVNLPAAPYTVDVTESSPTMAVVALRCECEGIFLRKEILIDAERQLAVRYELAADGPRSEIAFGSEIDFTLLGPDAVEGGRRVEVIADGDEAIDPAPGASGTVTAVRGVRLIAEAIGVHVEIEIDPPAELWRFPLESVAKTERGFAAGYQGTVLAFIWRGEIGEGSTIRSSIRCDMSRCRKT